MRTLLVSSLVSLALVACGPAATLTTDRSEYTAGDTVVLTLKNDGVFALGTGPLENADLSRVLGDGTQAVIGDDFNLLGLVEVPGGKEFTLEKVLPSDLTDGEYQYRQAVGTTDDADRDWVVTPEFTVHARQ